MILFPNAKINIGLSVTRKRSDGFHDIETILYPIGLCDVLEYVEAKESNTNEGTIITYSGSVTFADQDICMKVLGLLKKMFNIPPLRMHLLKNIPVGAGLGGGSSDAAFLLKSLNESFALKLSRDRLEELADHLGSDCPFFIRNNPCYVSGKGNRLQEISLSLEGYWLFLVYPGFHINTKDAYQAVTPSYMPGKLKDLIDQPPDYWKNIIKNQFEDSMFRKYPLLQEIKEKLYEMGAVYASMSGSGSGMYGIFNSEVKIPSKFNSFFTYKEFLKI
ncbi:MAG: hypothetical protein AMS27_03530 [Bacteroides sp. SM23_62_1]|nr:MAG: hypothetical protein AMS27_03530 [Bacteroides sp. SM23_62_1]